jgi:hypothetical protein
MNYIMKLNLHGDVNESNTPAYTKETNKNCEKNEFNDLTNKLANNIYSYEDRADYTYRSVILIIQKIKLLQTYM